MGHVNNWGAGLRGENGQHYDFIVNREDILRAIATSLQNGTAIGIYSPALGNTMFITGVDELFVDGDNSLIILKRYDMSGHIFVRNTIILHEIVSVCPFTSPLKNPFLDKVENGVDWLVIINSEDDPSKIHRTPSVS